MTNKYTLEELKEKHRFIIKHPERGSEKMDQLFRVISEHECSYVEYYTGKQNNDIAKHPIRLIILCIN